MATDNERPIIIKRIKKKGHAAHGAAWKIAYADFVTAMMAFFLLMWLLGSTTKGDLQGIADYFRTPLKVALSGGSGSGDSSSVIQGGGKDLTRTSGQQQKADSPAPKRAINLQAAQAEIERQELQRLAQLKTRIEAAIEANPTLRAFRKQLRVDLTPDGLRIQMVDESNRPMFDSGSAQLKDYTREILHELGKVLNGVPNRISLSGHTDAAPYASGERAYSNWELSADRANASRRELIIGGIDENKLIRVVGMGPAVMLDKADPLNPANRRISIVVLNQRAEKRILNEDDPSVVAEALGVAGASGTDIAPEAPVGPAKAGT
ncbi:MAG: flagellar motor protein MotB [Betaproteobacteria bacterium]